MKTTIVSQGAEPVAAETFPALFISKSGSEAVYFFINSETGYCLHVGGSVWKFGEAVIPSNSYKRLTTPVTITFTP